MLTHGILVDGAEEQTNKGVLREVEALPLKLRKEEWYLHVVVQHLQCGALADQGTDQLQHHALLEIHKFVSGNTELLQDGDQRPVQADRP